MGELLDRIPPIDWALGWAVAIAGLIAVATGRRGGRFRGLPEWGGFWVLFGILLICLSRAHHWVSFPLLALFMFAALRAYFSLAPVRPRDRYAILVSYLAIPFALWPAFTGADDAFLATVPVILFLFIPFFLSFGNVEKGLLDAMGRTLLGVLFFVFCLAHLGLLVHERQPGLLELFGVLVLGAELPQRLFGRFRPGSGWLRPTIGVLTGALLAVALGFWLGPWCGLVEEDGGRAGLLVLLAATLGAQVSEAVAVELSPSTSSHRIGRGALLNRMVPAVYAAPVYFHYLHHFA